MFSCPKTGLSPTRKPNNDSKEVIDDGGDNESGELDVEEMEIACLSTIIFIYCSLII